VRASDIVRQFGFALTRSVQQRRRRTMIALVDGLVKCQRATLTSLGRSLAGVTSPKHCIKRVDRFVGNAKVHDDVAHWYAAIARRLLRNNRRPIILIDWTQTIGTCNALVAGVAFCGRAIPIYAEVHAGEDLGGRSVQHAFLKHLSSVLPAGTRPIIVADAGFKTPFFSSVRERSWDFVIRLRGKGILRRTSPSARQRDPRLRFEAAFDSATDRARDLGEWTPYAATGALNVPYRIVLSARPARAEGPARKDPYARRALEPWLLATTIERERPARIVELYRLRMQIELTFRDTKNGRCGFGLEYARSRDRHRQEILLLIACLALAAVLLIGLHAEAQGAARRHQANTLRGRRVNSLSRLGELVLAEGWSADPKRILLDGRKAVVAFVRTDVQLVLPKTTWHYGRFR
jgi:hypothetical protein